MIFCELTLAIYKLPPHRRRTGGPEGAAQRGVRLDLGGVSQSTLWRQGWTLVCFMFIFYFVRLPLCNKYFYDIVTFISIHSVIICVLLLWRTYVTHPALSLKSKCDSIEHEEESIVEEEIVPQTENPLEENNFYFNIFGEEAETPTTQGKPRCIIPFLVVLKTLSPYLMH